MHSPIRIGDQLENGGQVTSASPAMKFMNLPLACKGGFDLDAGLIDGIFIGIVKKIEFSGE
ncbi:hypothetical protein [Cupriavidus basilensis]|uniref:hypothetical protein n=1 Tax=Cupriavidus basilensis TaxID=68895 RepID=UPI0039F6DC83